MEVNIRVRTQKLRDVKTPGFGTVQSAGIDFYVPKFDDAFKVSFAEKNDPLLSTLIQNPFDKPKIAVYPGCRVLIPSGIRICMTKPKQDRDKLALVAFNKSGVSSKFGLSVLACVVDEDYQGEVHISLVNTGNKTVYIYPEDKIVQFIPLVLPVVELIEVGSNDLMPYTSNERLDGGFGHTGND